MARTEDPRRTDAPAPEKTPSPLARPFSRRGFLAGAGGLAAGGALAAEPARTLPKGFADPLARVYRFEDTVPVELTLNGKHVAVECETRTTLLDLLRVHLPEPLTGAKLVCDRGACGACTVLLDGAPVYACNTLAANVHGREVTTVEGLGSPDELSPVQEAFCARDALMCGFCTPGFVVSVTACLERNPHATEDEVRAACSGNLCRCGTYPHIWEAAHDAGLAMQRQEATSPGGAGKTKEGQR